MFIQSGRLFPEEGKLLKWFDDDGNEHLDGRIWLEDDSKTIEEFQTIYEEVDDEWYLTHVINNISEEPKGEEETEETEEVADVEGLKYHEESEKAKDINGPEPLKAPEEPEDLEKD